MGYNWLYKILQNYLNHFLAVPPIACTTLSNMSQYDLSSDEEVSTSASKELAIILFVLFKAVVSWFLASCYRSWVWNLFLLSWPVWHTIIILRIYFWVHRITWMWSFIFIICIFLIQVTTNKGKQQISVENFLIISPSICTSWMGRLGLICSMTL